MNTLLNDLHNQRLIWPGSAHQPAERLYSSGSPSLDRHLQGGFPHSLVVLVSPLGIGELRLLVPFLCQPHRQDKLLFFIAPPHPLNADMLASNGICLSRVLTINPATTTDALWATEQCLNSGACGAVILWDQPLSRNQIKRLQLACQQGQATLFLFQAPGTPPLTGGISLSLSLSAHAQGIVVTTNKQRGVASNNNTVLITMETIKTQTIKSQNSSQPLPSAFGGSP